MSNIGITNTTFFKILFIYFFFKRERKGRKKRERETLMCKQLFASPTPPTVHLACSPGSTLTGS